MTAKIQRGWEILRQSWNVLRLDKELMLFPALSFLACLLVLATFAGPLFLVPDLAGQLFGEGGGEERQLETWQQVLLWVAAFAFYFVNYFVIVFFNTALVSCAFIRFGGGNPTLGDGLRAATARLPQIAAWALLASTVGMVLKGIEERVGLVGKWVVRLVGLAWTVVTYLVVPVLAVEKMGPIAAVRRSAELLRRAWGESLTGQVSIALVNLLLMVPGLLLMVGGAAAIAGMESLWLGAPLIFLGLLYIIGLSIVTSTMQQVFLAGSYLYAAEGRVPEGFSEDLMKSAFKKSGRG